MIKSKIGPFFISTDSKLSNEGCYTTKNGNFALFGARGLKFSPDASCLSYMKIKW